jgi:hypothetical protein
MYATIRDKEFLGDLIGKRVVDITQHDEDEWSETGESYIMLMFEDGLFVKFPIGDDGFTHNCGPEEDE